MNYEWFKYSSNAITSIVDSVLLFSLDALFIVNVSGSEEFCFCLEEFLPAESSWRSVAQLNYQSTESLGEKSDLLLIV